ncbi:hypothetical protein C0J52_01865 [Blattella germanica]|nr:hypothetical protein C0J52_01865 [Blattella germanica]
MAVEDSQVPVEVTSPNIDNTQIEGQLCNNTYLSWGNLVAHRKACHRGEILNCDDCGKRRFHPGLGPVNFPVLEENKPEQKDSAKGKKSKGCKIETLPSGDKRFKKQPSGDKPFRKQPTSVNENNIVILPSGEKRFKCYWCPKTFTANKGLKQHIYKHPAKEDYRCDCGQVFHVFEDMSNHVQTEHVDCNLTCNICYKRLKAGDEFLTHYHDCHSARELEMSSMRISNVTCPVCDKVFSQPSALHRHRRLHNPLSCRHVCEKCGDVITCRGKILEHAREHYGDELPELYKQFEQIIVKRKKDKEKKSFICEYCGREFSEKLNLQIHVRRHTGDRPYNCQLCGKAFYTNQQLAIHVRRHTGERPYPCGICPKAFTGPTARYAHRKLHDKVKRFLCPHCGKRFFWKSTYIGHVRLHTGERPYKCNICSKGFTLKGKLHLHLKKHLPEHTIHVCSDCGENFSSAEDLKAHREEQCCMTMVTYVQEGPNGEKDTRIIVVHQEDVEKNNIYLDNSEVVQLVVE